MDTLTVLFWNMHKSQAALRHLGGLALATAADIVVVAESPPADGVVVSLSAATARPWQLIEPSLGSRVLFFAAAPVAAAFGGYQMSQSDFASLRCWQPGAARELIIGGVHLKSKVDTSPERQQAGARELVELVLQLEERRGHRRTVLLGDFNMDPWDTGMSTASGLFATMSQDEARAGPVIRSKRKYLPFYNPSWSLLGDLVSRPPASWPRARCDVGQMRWHLLDQVLLRPALAERPGNSLRLLREYNDLQGRRLNLYDGPLGEPNRALSDHFPLVVTLDLNDGAPS